MPNEGIGVQKEYLLHQTLKRMLVADENAHEVPIGKFVADAAVGRDIYEIQTKEFYRLREKLEYYLAEDYHVTIVYPVFAQRYMRWVDPQSGEIGERRRVPRVGSVQDVFLELYAIQPFLNNERLSLCIFGLAIEELKLQDGYGKDRKRYATRIERRLSEVLYRVDIPRVTDLSTLLPADLPQHFTAADYAAVAHCNINSARAAVRILTTQGTLLRAGKRNRAHLYQRVVAPAQVGS